MADYALSDHARALLEVMQWPGVGQAKGRDLARAAISLKADVRELARSRTRQASGLEQEAAAREAESILTECARLHLAVVALGDPHYPTRLAEISDAPALIFVKGDCSSLTRAAVAVVGTRDASPAGLRAATAIGELLARRGLVVVSGLALGIDAAAHTGALNGSGQTVAVLAHGLDSLSPKTNAPIAERILGSGGALISEHPPGVPARPAEFVRRNRIQSGMSICSIVVESGEKGGAMHQAAFTVQQGRPLLTVLSSQKGAGGINEAGARRLISEFHAVAVRGTSELGAWLEQLRSGPGDSTSASGQRELDW